MLLLVLFGVLGAYQAFAEEACYGEDFTFPYFISKLMRQRKVVFTPKSSLGSARVVMDEGKPIDGWFKGSWLGIGYMKIVNVTMDYEGEYAFYFYTTNQTDRLITLRVKDCSIEKQVLYGKSYSFDVSRAEQIKYSRSFNDLEMPVTLWSRNKAIEKAGWTLKGHVLVMSRLTQKDQGYYTLRNKNQEYLEKYHIIIEEFQQNYFLERGEHFTITFPVVGVHFSLTYQPENGVSMPVTLIHSDSGYLANSEVFEGRIELPSTGVRIRKLEAQDAGIFRLYDSDGNLALVVQLTIKPLRMADFGLNFSTVLGAVVVVIVISLCCCGNNCFGRKKRPTSSPVTQVDHHEVRTQRPTSSPGTQVYHQEVRTQRPTSSPGTQVYHQEVRTQRPTSSPGTQVYHHEVRTQRPTSSPGTQVSLQETTANYQTYYTYYRQRQLYSMAFNQSPYDPDKPLASAANQQPQASDILNPPSYNDVAGGGGNLGPSSTSVTPAHVGPVYFQGSAAGVPTTTLGFDCLSSDSRTQFEVPKGLTYPSAPFLSSDTPSNDVYSSNKLNFM